MIRIDVNENSNDFPQVLDTVMWGWNGSGYDNSCVWKSAPDTDIDSEHVLYRAKGKWGVFVHHFDAKLLRFGGASGAQ